MDPWVPMWSSSPEVGDLEGGRVRSPAAMADQVEPQNSGRVKCYPLTSSKPSLYRRDPDTFLETAGSRSCLPPPLLQPGSRRALGFTVSGQSQAETSALQGGLAPRGLGGHTRGAHADSSGQLPGHHTTITHTWCDFKSYRFSSSMLFNRTVGALFPCSLVSLKDEWNEGSSRLGVVIKHLEVESKRQKRNNYKYSQAVVTG